MTDELCAFGFLFAFRFRQFVEKGAGAGTGNRAERGDQILMAHANAIIGNGDAVIGIIHCDFDRKATLIADQAGLGQGFIAQLLASIRGIGDKLADENIAVGID